LPPSWAGTGVRPAGVAVCGYRYGPDRGSSWPGWPGMPGIMPRPGGTPRGRARRICSSWAPAPLRLADSLGWMPGNRPPLQPADQLSLGHAQLSLAGHAVVVEGQREPLQLLDQLGGQAVLEFLDRALVDLPQPGPALLVQGRGPDLFQQLADHAAHPHDLGGLLDHLGHRPLAGFLDPVP